jgi:hypothetical protein
MTFSTIVGIGSRRIAAQCLLRAEQWAAIKIGLRHDLYFAQVFE